ncbi:MAG: DUF2171 domain-containing protein [Moraxellaceae bacterium]|nr:MAG: DUF2171 domain-containing protein [Moraxellaceae bacterium]
MAQQIDINDIKQHAEVVGSDQQHVGKVDHALGTDQIKLAKHDSDSDNTHHAIPVAWVDSINNGRVVLNKTAAEAQQQWRSL